MVETTILTALLTGCWRRCETRLHLGTDDYSVNVVENPVHVHDLQATILQQLGIDHESSPSHQGRYYRLTDVHGKVVHDVLS